MEPVEPTTKTVYFIRHAESEENRRIAALSRVFRGLGRLSLPSSADVVASTELMNVAAQVDSNVSDIGAKQISQMGEKLRDVKFLVSTGIQLVAHSPLLRARETSEGMLGCIAPDTKVDPVNRVVELDLLAEKTPKEWAPGYFSAFKKRISSFEHWLAEQPETTVAIVGHSQYFKAMFGLDFKFGNCDVWQATFHPAKLKIVGSTESETVETCTKTEDKAVWTLPPQWSNLQQLYKCEIEGSKKE